MADEGETKFCSNCKRDIAASNFVMHEVHCRRHIVLCEHCKEPVPYAELDQHFSDLHAKIPCERCKVQVSKEDMKKHVDSECDKKPVMCEYCELSFPKCEMASHSDYCGSRTECCSSCQQYIMLKDMLRHENSGCTYPEPKPPPPVSNSDHDPSRMNELFQDMFDISGLRDSDIPFDFTTENLARELTRNTDTRNRWVGAQTSSTSISTPSRTLQGNTNRGRQTGQKKSDVNVQRARNLSTETGSETWQTAIPPDMDYDTMFALQMAHEEWQELPDESGDVGQLSHLDWSRFDMGDFVADRNVWESSDAPLNPRVNNTQFGTDVYQDEDMTIPCEFCDMEIPLVIYLEHVESCPLGGADSVHDNRNKETTSLAPRANIPVINNLGTGLSVSSPNATPLTRAHLPEEEFVLPCEFCEDIFPAHIIFEHQNVCHANGMAMPQLTTPTSSTSRDHQHSSTTTSTPAPQPSLKPPQARSRPRLHHPNPPLIDFVHHSGDDSDDQEECLDPIKFHRVPESSSNKYKPAINRFDDAMIHPRRRSSRQYSNEDEADLTNHRQNDTEGRRPNKNANYVRARLDQLLQEDGISGASPINPSTTRKTAKPPVTVKNRSGPRDRNCNTDSRNVMKQLDRANRTPARRRHDENSTVEDSDNRARQRSNQMFSPELRLKPDHNLPQSKKR